MNKLRLKKSINLLNWRMSLVVDVKRYSLIGFILLTLLSLVLIGDYYLRKSALAVGHSSMTIPQKHISNPQKVVSAKPSLLENENLKSLSYVGFFKQGSRMWGLIRQANGYIVSVHSGDYIGNRHGKIIHIDDAQLQIEEITFFAGQSSKKLKTLVLVRS